MIDLCWIAGDGHRWCGRLGLVLDLAGAVFLVWGGTPPMYRPRYAIIAPNDYDDPEKEQEDFEQEAVRWRRRTRLGVWLLALGFALQLAGSLVKR